MTLPFTDWARDNKSDIMAAQVQAGHEWLHGEMVDSPDLDTFGDCIEDGYKRNAWYDHLGRQNRKEAFNAYWDEAKSGYPLLRIAYNHFSQGKEHWSGYDTVSELYEEARTGVRRERQKIDEVHQQERQKAREERQAKRAAKEKKDRDSFESALALYENLSEAKTWGKYFQDKGFKGTPTIPGLKRVDRKHGGSYDVLPIKDIETGEITSFERYYDEPFEIRHADGKVVTARKIYQRGGSVKGGAIFLDPFPDKKFSDEFRMGEGVATLLSVRRAGSSEKVCHVAALSANNLAPVYNGLAQRWPKVAKAGRIRPVLDNDWQKALEHDPKNGDLKSNTGLTKGHQLAMRHMIRVYQPDFTAFKDAKGSLSDFNDLARVAGLDEVKRQLVLKDPDQDFAFARAAKSDHARKLALYAKHDVTVLNADQARYFSADHIKKGRVNILLGAPDTGKSTATKAFHDAHPDQSRLTIVPLASLAENKAEELGDACYSAPEFKDKRLLRQQDHLVICVDSLIHLVPGEQLDPDDPDEMRLFKLLSLKRKRTSATARSTKWSKKCSCVVSKKPKSKGQTRSSPGTPTSTSRICASSSAGGPASASTWSS